MVFNDLFEGFIRLFDRYFERGAEVVLEIAAVLLVFVDVPRVVRRLLEFAEVLDGFFGALAAFRRLINVPKSIQLK